MMKFPLFCGRLVFAAALLALGARVTMADDAKSLDISALGVKADSGEDATMAVRNAIEQCHQQGIQRLVFSPGRYDFFPDHATEEYLFISNNDEGLKRIAFPISGFDKFEIDGKGASFVFHNFIIPFAVEKSHNVTIKNLSIDYARTFHSEGKVLAVTPDSVDLEIAEDYPYKLVHGILVFTDGKGASGPETTVKDDEVVFPYNHVLAFDPVKQETAFMARDTYGLQNGVAATTIGERKLRVNIPKVSAQPGNILVFGAANRNIPGVFITDSSNVLLQDLSIYHAGGMATITQRSSDIDFEKVKLTPPPGGKRIISSTADATHFLNCTGKITMRDCVFENQMDDATNIHGLYARITKILAPDKIETRLMHPQQAGVDFISAGSHLELVGGSSMATIGEALVKSVDRLNKEITVVQLNAPLPAGIKEGDDVANTDANSAEVLIKGCTIGKNRARGILLGSRGKIVIEDNVFHTPGAAILFEGNTRHWYEQAGVRDCVIRHNTFDNCNYGVWGKACIESGPGIAEADRKTTRYNKNVTIEDNQFKAFSPLPLVEFYSFDGLTIRNNRLERTTTYPGGNGPKEFYYITDSDQVSAEPPKEGAGR